jgi:hypothetical protein
LSLLLQLLLVALLVLAVGDPRLGGRSTGRHLVVLVDASASMKSIDVSPSRMTLAKSEVTKLIGGLGGADQMLIAKMDASLTPLTPLTSDVTELERAVQDLHASDTRADLSRGIAFGLDTLRGLENPEMVLVSDGALAGASLPSKAELGTVKLSFVAVGKSGDNLAITAFSARRYPLDKSHCEVMVEVTNTNRKPVEVELTLLGDGQVVDVTRLALGPEQRLPRFYSDLGGAARSLEAIIKPLNRGTDQLPADDHAYALMPERRRARVLVVSSGNTYLEAALLLDEYLDVSWISLDQYPPRQNFDVTIFDRVAPPLAENTGSALYIAPPPNGAPVELGRELKMFGFDSWDKDSPILRWMAPGDVQVASGHALKPERGDRVLGASENGPILVLGKREGKEFLVLGFDPRDSDFVLRVAWPLFVLNTINYFVAEDVHYISSFRTGEVWRMPAPAGAELGTLIDPRGRAHSVSVRQGSALYLGDQAGFYKLTAQSELQPVTTTFAANLTDVEESHIQPVTKLDLGGAPAAPPRGLRAGAREELWVYLLIAVVLLSAIEWLTYHRRWTV